MGLINTPIPKQGTYGTYTSAAGFTTPNNKPIPGTVQSQAYKTTPGFGNNPAPVMPSITDSGVNEDAKEERKAQALRNQIGKDWEGSGDEIGNTSGALKGFAGSIGNLTKARDAYLSANDANKLAKLNAIGGNRTLITKNQTGDLRDLAENLRKSVFNTNLSLGAGAGSSASQAAARALSQSAGKNRAQLLTGYGDQISEQNQNEVDTNDNYAMQRDKAYKWEEDERGKATQLYKEEKAILDRLKSKVPDWKKADIEAESNSRLQELFQSLAGIQSQARGYRDSLANLMTGMTGSADALRAENIGINTPAELDTPEFNDQIDTTGLDGEDQYTEDYYNPNVKFKKREGANIFSNPLIFGE
jgi:hypothetical protein